MELVFVYAQDRNGGIGKNNDMPWHLPNELQHFKDITMGQTMVMGRKTFESMNQRLLPGRQTVVVTRQEDYGADIEGLEVVHNIEDLLKRDESTLMIIGGAGLFEDLWPYATQIERTVIDASFDCDVFVPELDLAQWKLISTIDIHNDDYPYTYETWQNKNSR